MADELAKKKMANAKRANTREVNAGKREATPPSKGQPDKRYMPKGILTDPTTGRGAHIISNRTGEILREDMMEKRGPTSRFDAATGVGHKIITPADLARVSRERLPAAQRQMGRRVAGYTKGPDIVAGRPRLDKDKPYSRELSGEKVDKSGRITTPSGDVVKKRVADQGTRGRAALRRIEQAGARPTDAFKAELARRRTDGNNKVELANSKAVTARQAAQAYAMREMMGKRRAEYQTAKEQAAAQTRANSVGNRAKSAVNNAVNKGRSAASAGRTYRQNGKMPPKIEANWPKNARSVGRAQGAIAGTAAALAATGVRTAREVSNAEFRGFVKGKVAGRQSDSSGRMTGKGPAAVRTPAPKKDLPSNASYFTKSLMK